jgi:hypothetical protein
MAFRIDPEFRDFLPRQSAEDFDRLRRKIVDEGVHRGSVVVGIIGDDSEYVLIDGHHTLEACKRENVDPPAPKKIHFPDRDAAFQWMIDNQLSRRNLTPEQRAYYIGRKYLAERKDPGESMRSQIVHAPDDRGRTAEKIAAETGESAKTVQRNAAFAQGVDALSPEARHTVLAGKSGQTKAEIATSVFCRNCRVHGPKKGCKACTDLRREKGLLDRPAATVKPPKAGKLLFDYKAFHTAYGKLVQQVDKLYAAYGLKTDKGVVKRDAEHNAMDKALNAYLALFKERYARFAKEPMPEK